MVVKVEEVRGRSIGTVSGVPYSRIEYGIGFLHYFT